MKERTVASTLWPVDNTCMISPDLTSKILLVEAPGALVNVIVTILPSALAKESSRRSAQISRMFGFMGYLWLAGVMKQLLNTYSVS